MREQRIYCAEQIYVPENLPIIIKHYSKEVIRSNPGNPTPEELYEFSMKYVSFVTAGTLETCSRRETKMTMTSQKSRSQTQHRSKT